MQRRRPNGRSLGRPCILDPPSPITAWERRRRLQRGRSSLAHEPTRPLLQLHDTAVPAALLPAVPPGHPTPGSSAAADIETQPLDEPGVGCFAWKMGRESSRDADDGAGRPERRRHHGGESHDWKIRDDAASHSLPHRRRSEVQRSGTRTSNKARGPLSLDATEPTMPPPRLARASTDGYRRPREAVVYSDDERVSGGRRHSRRELSPTYDYHRRRRQAEYSESSPSSSSKETTDDDESSERETRDEDRETVDEADDEASRERRRRIPGPEDSMESFEDRRRQITGPEDSMESFDDRRRHRRRRHGRSLDDEDRRRHSTSDVNSPGRHPRAPELSESPRRSHRHHHMTDIIATSRPPVASKKFVDTLRLLGNKLTRSQTIETRLSVERGRLPRLAPSKV